MFVASMTLILGVYGSNEIMLGPNASRLIQANSIFVQDIKASIILEEYIVLHPPIKIGKCYKILLIDKSRNNILLPNLSTEF